MTRAPNAAARPARPARLLAGLALALALAACARGRARPDYAVSSERSDYSPVVRLDVRVAIDDSVRVTVGGGSVLAPGEPPANPTAVMRELTIAALVVRAPGPDDDLGGPARAWTSIVESPSQPLVDSLTLGAARAVGPLRFALERTADLDLARSWLAFRIHGATLTTPVTMADGTVVPVRLVRDGVRVYACAERDLTGKVNRERRERLRESYGAVC